MPRGMVGGCRRWQLLLLLCRIAPAPAALLGRAPVRVRVALPPRCRRTLPVCAQDKNQLLLPRLGPVPELPELSEEDVRVLSEGKVLQRQIIDGPDVGLDRYFDSKKIDSK